MIKIEYFKVEHVIVIGEQYTIICYLAGHKVWGMNGKYHRKNGPAIEYSDGYKSWWQNGKLHREDGPAIEEINDRKEWFLNGKKYTEIEFDKITKTDN